MKSPLLGPILGGLALLGVGVALLGVDQAALGGVAIVSGLVSWGRAIARLVAQERLKLHAAWAALARDTGLALVELSGGAPGFDRRLEGPFQGHTASVVLVPERKGGAVLECRLTPGAAGLGAPGTVRERPGLGLWPFSPEAERRRADRVQATLQGLAARLG